MRLGLLIPHLSLLWSCDYTHLDCFWSLVSICLQWLNWCGRHGTIECISWFLSVIILLVVNIPVRLDLHCLWFTGVACYIENEICGVHGSLSWALARCEIVGAKRVKMQQIKLENTFCRKLEMRTHTHMCAHNLLRRYVLLQCSCWW